MNTPSQCCSSVLLAVLLTASAGAQDKLNVIRIEPVGEGEGRALRLEGFSYVGSPTYSKDGKWIAFDGYKGDAANVISECWIVRSDGKEPRRLARGATPRFSPDGESLIFMREERNDLGRPGGENVGIFVIGIDGSDERRLCDGRWPDWSPDGSRIVFSVGGKPTGGARARSRICIAKADGSEPQEIVLGDCPSWSPDGDRIACCFNDPAIGIPMIRVVDLKTENETLLGPGWFRANWSADSKTLYAIGVVRNRAGMVRLSATKRGEAEPILTKFAGQSPCPSPDGKEIVFCTTPEKPGPVQ